MAKAWRLVLLTAAVGWMTAADAAAQTVYLRNAPAGSNLEVVVNNASAGTGVVDAAGESKVTFTLPQGLTEMDSNVFFDVCGKVRKVLIVDRNKPAPPPAAGCDRREIAGIYWVRPINTIVVDAGSPNPSLLLVRGEYTPPRLTAEGEEEHQTKPLPTGLMMFAGGAFTSLPDFAISACGNATPCNGHWRGPAYSFGASVWLTRFIGVEGTYIKPRQVSLSGGDSFTFKSTLDTDVWTVAGKVGAQAGIVRVYGKAGLDYHQATAKTSETIELATQSFEYSTKGWSWLFGGGLEVWLGAKQRVAIYGDGSVVRLRGKADTGEYTLDERMKFVAVGIKLRLSR